ncbi:MAG: hypothetical protein ABI076_09690 [Acidobacteriaceae bacterium]
MTVQNAWSQPGFEQSTPSDWSASYAQFLTGSGTHAAKTLKFYQEILEYVARGQLAATVFQEYYPRFAETHGAGYTKRLNELAAEFLRSLVELSATESQRSAAAENLDAEIAEIQLPVFEIEDPTRWFEQYAEFAGQLNARALKAYRKQLDHVAQGEASPEEVQQKVASLMSRQLPDTLQRVGHLYLDVMNKLNDVRANYEEEYFLGLVALAKGHEKDPIVLVPLSGPQGGVASASLTVANTTTQRTPVRYTGTEVRRMDGVGAAFPPKIVIQPEALELGPGEEATISFSIQLETDHYETDMPYMGFLYITGDGDLRVEMQLRIVATPPAGKDS